MTQAGKVKKRLHFLDNLRTFLVFLVVVNHSGWVYESSGVGAFFWLVDDPDTNRLSGQINTIIDMFVMSLIFFVSGYFTLPSLKSKAPVAYIRSKLKRLMLPWLIAVLTLIPLYKVIFLYSRGIPQDTWTSYFHWANGGGSQNWLWFLPVLFMFDMIFLGLSKIPMNWPKISRRTGIIGFFILALSFSLFMDLNHLEGWTKSALLDFQNERLFIYFMMFLLGALSQYHAVFDIKPARVVSLLLILACVSVPLFIYLKFNTQGFVFPGTYILSKTGDSLVKWSCFHLSLLGIGYFIIEGFRLLVDRRNRFMDELNRNTYNVYIIHAAVLGGIALLLLETNMPSILKYVILILSTYTSSNIIVHLHTRFIKPILTNLQRGNVK